MAKNILSVRLQKLVEHGILATAPASDGTAYKEYVLTPKGKKLYLVLVALWQWGEEFCFAPGEHTYDMVDAEAVSAARTQGARWTRARTERYARIAAPGAKGTTQSSIEPIKPRRLSYQKKPKMARIKRAIFVWNSAKSEFGCGDRI